MGYMENSPKLMLAMHLQPESSLYAVATDGWNSATSTIPVINVC